MKVPYGSWESPVTTDLLIKWDSLTETARLVLASLIVEGGINVKLSAVRQAVQRQFELSKNDVSEAVRKSVLEFNGTNLVKLDKNIGSGDELTLHPTWEWQLRRAISIWRASREQ